jgi:hypothetical protein
MFKGRPDGVASGPKFGDQPLLARQGVAPPPALDFFPQKVGHLLGGGTNVQFPHGANLVEKAPVFNEEWN